MLPNVSLRERARIVLGGKIFKNEWMYAVVLVLAISAVNGLASTTVVLPLLTMGVVNFAAARYFLLRVRNSNYHYNIFKFEWDLRYHIIDNVILGILSSLIILLFSLLLIVPGVIKACSYSMAYYIKCDNPEISAMDALALSKRMMDGHKMQYFRLQLSFIGWYIVGLLCLGVGVFWVSAYNHAANAAFYEEVSHVRI